MSTFRTSKEMITLLLLKQYRLDKNMSQAAFAKELGMTRAGWGKIENNNTSLTMEMFFRVCDMHNTSPQRVLQRVNDHIKVLVDRGWTVSSESVEGDDLFRFTQIQDNFIQALGFETLPVPDYYKEASEKYLLAECILKAVCTQEVIEGTKSKN